MLGFPSAMVAYANSTADDLYGKAPSGNNFVLADLGCNGDEASIFECPHSGEWSNDCEAFEIAGVVCATSKL